MATDPLDRLRDLESRLTAERDSAPTWADSLAIHRQLREVRMCIAASTAAAEPEPKIAKGDSDL